MHKDILAGDYTEPLKLQDKSVIKQLEARTHELEYIAMFHVHPCLGKSGKS